MPFSDRPFIESRDPSDVSDNGGLISSPDISESGKPRQHAVRDSAQAKEILRTLQAASRRRAVVNARIASKLAAERPYDQASLEAEGLGWRTNCSTRVLVTITNKVWPRFSQAVQGLKFFTNSSLSNKYANNVEKTEFFRQTITDCIREHVGWTDLIDSISFTNAVYGSNVVAFLDEFSFWPTSFDQSDVFLTDGCRQLPEYAQVVALHHRLMPHELFQRIKDRDEAKQAGWDIEATIEAINKASPAQLRDALLVGGTTDTWYANAAIELNVGSSYMAGASVISVYDLLVQEVNGKISNYKLAGDELSLIFDKDDRFDSPKDCLAFFSYERSNGTMHGSRGIGRAAYELAGMLDRSRNELIDRAIMSGKILVQGDVKRLHTYRMSVIGSTCVIPNGWTVLEQRVDGNPAPFLQLDSYFSGLIDAIIGNVSPPQLGGGGEAMRSSASWAILAAREEEGRDSNISRFMQQFVALIGTMQRRICSKDAIDDDAKAAYEKLKEKMTEEEIKELAESPVAGTIVDLTPIERQMVVALAQEKAGNPIFNQRQLQVEDVTARLGTQFAERVILPVEDPTEEAEQTRLQLLEITLLAMGQPVPVSPRDGHEIHIKALLPAAEQLAGQIMQGAGETAGLEAMIDHVTQHVNAATAAGVPKEALQQAMALVKGAGAALAQLKDLDAQAAQLQQEDAAAEAPPPQ